MGEMLGEGEGLDWVEACLWLLVSCPGIVRMPSVLVGLPVASMISAQLEADTANCKVYHRYRVKGKCDNNQALAIALLYCNRVLSKTKQFTPSSLELTLPQYNSQTCAQAE